MSEKKKNLPARGWKIPAAVCALLLTVTLFLTQAGLIGIHVLTSRSLHERVALTDETIDTQMTRIGAAIDALAEEYGFKAEPVKAAVNREEIRELNRQTVGWWTGVTANGEAGELPSWYPSLADTLNADADFIASLNPMTVNSTIQSIESRVGQAGRKSVVLFRDEILNALLGRVKGRVDLPEMMGIIRILPLTGALVSLLLMGLIALMLSRRIPLSGQYIGGAFSACGLLMILEWVLVKTMNLRGMIGEASTALMNQYVHLARILTLEVLGGAVLMMVLGGLCMAWAEKSRRKVS